MKKYLGAPQCLAHCLIESIDIPSKGSERIFKTYYKGSAGPFSDAVQKGQSDGPLLINAVKLYHTKDYKSFYVLGRVISGTIKKNEKLRIMG